MATATRSPSIFPVTVRRGEREAAHPLRSPGGDDGLARQVDARGGHARRVQRALERRRGRRAVEDDHLAPGRDRADAPVKRQPPAGTRRDHARAIVVGERQVLIVPARRVEVPPRPHAHQPAAGDDRQQAASAARRFVLRVVADGGRARDQLRPGGARLRRHRGGARRAGGLGQERAARRRLLVVERDARAGRRLGDGPRRREPGRSAADHAGVERLVERRQPRRGGRVGERPRSAHLAHQLQEQRIAGVAAGHHRVVVHPLGEEPVGGGQEVDVGAGEGVLPRAAEIGARRRQAGALVGAAVDPQKAGGAVSVEAEKPARAVVLRRAGQGLDASGVQRDGDRLPREGGDALSLEVDGDREAARGAGGQGKGKIAQVGGHVLSLPVGPICIFRPEEIPTMTNRFVRSIAAATVLTVGSGSVGCGYLLHPERRGIQSGVIDGATMVMDCLWLLVGVVPGVVALIVDFSSGGI